MSQLYLEHLYGISQLYTWGLFSWYLSHFHEEVCLWVCPKSFLLFWAINFDMFKYKIVTSWSTYLLFGLRITLSCEKWFWKYESKIRGLEGSLSCDLVNIPLHVILIVPPFSQSFFSIFGLLLYVYPKVLYLLKNGVFYLYKMSRENIKRIMLSIFWIIYLQ